MGRLYEIIRSPLAPLAEGSIWSEWQQWFDLLFKYVENTVLRSDVSGDAAATILRNQSYHGVTALTAPRTITLPSASSIEDGHMLIIQDESGSAGSQTITIAPASGDTLTGTSSITSNNGRAVLIKRGVSTWYSV